MADHHHHQQQQHHQQLTLNLQASGKSMLSASLAGAAIGGPLFGMMGFSFTATSTLLLICSPLLLVFSPLLLCALSVLVGTFTGFTAAIAMGTAGVLTLAWIYREFKGHIGLGFRDNKEQLQDLTGHLLQRVDGNSTQEDRLIKIE